MLALGSQDVTTSALLLILNSTRSTDITNLVKGLSGDQQDRLMAYLYKVSIWLWTIREPRLTQPCLCQGMANLGEKSEISGSVLLSWHEKVSDHDRLCEIAILKLRPHHVRAVDRGSRCWLHRKGHD